MHPAQATLAGLCAIGIALGMSRFAYTPLVPALIRDDWTTIPQAGFLGGANCFGYLVSCVIAITLPRILGVRQVMRIGLGAGLLGVLLSSFNFGFIWLVIARFIAGLSAAPLVVLTPSVLSTQMPERWRKLSAGLAFSGAGLFTLLVSLTLPFVLHQNVQVGWFYETAVVAVAVLLTWPLTSRASNKPLPPPAAAEHLNGGQRKVILGLGLAYACGAIGMQPPTLFLTDYLHRDLGVQIATASQLFSVIGLGFAIGAGCSGVLVSRLGSRISLLLIFATGTVGVLMATISHQLWLITIAAGLCGFFVLGMVATTSQRAMEAVGTAQHPRIWGTLSLVFAIGLTAGSNGMSLMLKLGFSYIQLFVIAIIALAMGVIVTGLLSCRPLPSEAHTQH
ncbi:MAG: YbfB/YjiJ family MFS transporter [Prochlorococcus sp.]|jgi:predicted MFS family arabinose efflux permease|nr:YbfB/YjiJ family MFS transporter [Prochlorococcaceae cyanobacterium ETNP18_MAG_1]|tara:strand:+ start:184 stop:1362 length:1179 start_codon:yes stop_codon:yes gene_type:complete